MAKKPRPRPERAEQDEPEIAQIARQAVDAFRDEDPDAYAELARAFEGRGADLALLGGHGAFHAEVRDGEVVIDPGRVGAKPLTARGAASPETLIAIAEGRVTPLEAFFKGDVVAQARSADLHIVYGYFVKFADSALTSKGLQEVLGRFRETYPVESRYADWAEGR